MCGLAGEIRFDAKEPDVLAVQSITAKLESRGPNGLGIFSQANVALGHRRLTVLDLNATSAQPMVDAALGLVIVFNGCIYNYRELRRELEGKGYTFFSNGDTEVILKAYDAWGIDCAKRLHGMFAFAIWERDTRRVVLVRDRLGVKPLYIAEVPGALRFASTLPALLAGGEIDRTIDSAALHHYLSLHAVVPAPRTILNGVKKVPPATVVIIEPDGRQVHEKFWDYSVTQTPADRKRDDYEWEELLLDALINAVERRRVADVPMGVLLSGGLDSSVIVALLAQAGQRPLQTFSIGFEGVGATRGNEFRYSDLIASKFGTDHHKIEIGSHRLIDALPHAVAAMAEPMVSHDAVAFYLLSETVSEHVRVVLSGQGADEVLAGYHWYAQMHEANDPVSRYTEIYFDRLHDETGELLADAHLNGDWSGEFVRKFFDESVAENSVDKALEIDQKIMLPEDPVKRLDNMTMAFGIEARVPFLDHELVELAARIPMRLKLPNGGKHILKEAARGLVPDAIIDRAKGYFPVPSIRELDGAFFEFVRDVLNSEAARERGLFSPAYVASLFDGSRAPKTPKGNSKLWQLAVLEGWLQAQGI
jgi:asparagine synthase (glutamine-hydrolysing)